MFRFRLCLLLVVAVVTPVAGQPAPDIRPLQQGAQGIQIRLGGPAFPMNGLKPSSQFGLLSEPTVQKELKFTEQDKGRIEKAVAKIDEERLKWAQQSRGETNRAKRSQLIKQMNDKRAEIAKEAITALNPAQAKRLREISIQRSGMLALDDGQIAKELGITEEQRAKMDQVAETARLMRRQLSADIRNGVVPRDKYVEKREEIGKEIDAKTLAVLTDAQRAAFEKMKGKRFDLPKRTMQIRPVVRAPVR